MRAQWMRWSGNLALVLAMGAGLSSCKNDGSGSNTAGSTDCGTEGCQLLAPDSEPFYTFGFSIYIDGDRVVTGAASDDDGINSGAAYVYRRNESNWLIEQKLSASDAVGGDFFGSSVAISGDWVAVGAFREDFDDLPSTGQQNGAVYMYRFDGSVWVQAQKLLASDLAGGDLFGVAVDIDADTLVIGSFLDDASAADSGSAYIYRYDGASWIEEQKIVPASAAAFDRFGVSVGIDATGIVVGAYRDDDMGDSSGSAFVFRFNGATWVEEQQLNASDGAANDEFGFATQIDGDTIAVGSHLDDASAEDSGSAYVFRFDGTSWTQQQKITPADAAAFDSYGADVSIDNDLLVVGASRDDDDGLRSGSAYVYRFEVDRWVEAHKLTASDATTGDQFGISTAADDDRIAVGAYQAGPGDDASGAAYVFEL